MSYLPFILGMNIVNCLLPQIHSRVSLLPYLLGRFLVLISGIAFFILVARNISDGSQLTQVDQKIATELHDRATPLLTLILSLITLLGYSVLWGIATLIGIVLARQRKWIHLVTWTFGCLGGELLNRTLKQIFLRSRPVFDDPLHTVSDYSFPSGHAMFAVIGYGLLAYFVSLGTNSLLARIAVWLGALLLMLLIGFSRMYLGVHYLSDVVAGYAMGLVWLNVCIIGMTTARRHLERK